jgi:ABC-type amino acid transport substrate-binding protein
MHIRSVLIIGLAVAATSVSASAQTALRVVVPSHASGFSGLQWDVLSGFARLQKVAITKVEAVGIEPVQALTARAADVAAASARSMEGDAVDWSDEFLPSRFVIVTRSPKPTLTYLEELRGKRLGAAGPETVAAVEGAKLRPVPQASTDQGLAGLTGGTLDAVVLDLFEALDLRRRDPRLQLGVIIGSRPPIRFAMRRGDPRRAALNAYLAQLRASSSWGMLLARHLGPSGLDLLGRAKVE